MKNKTKTYVLLSLVLAVWSIIGFRIVSTLNPDAPKIIEQNEAILFSPKTNIDKEVFSIEPLNRDPFLGTLYIKKKTNPEKKRSEPKEELVWIPIVYHGTVSKQSSKDKLCVLSINGQQQIMRVGQELNAVTLIKAENETVLVSYKGVKKIISKI